MLKIGLLGAGAIGRIIATALDPKCSDGKPIDAEIVAICDQDRERATQLSSELSTHPAVIPLEEMIDKCELAVEAASQGALPAFVPKALECRRDMLVMSVGGLLGHDDWFRQAGSTFRPARSQGWTALSPLRLASSSLLC
jgi:predicted dinucleotide-utilizing enzyme